MLYRGELGMYLNKNLLLITLISVNFGLGAKSTYQSLCDRIAQRDQDDCATIVHKTLNKIEKQFAAEFAILDQYTGEEQKTKLMALIADKASNYWFYSLERGDGIYSYRYYLLPSIKKLNRYKNGRFMGNQAALNSNANLANALYRLNQVQTKLYQIDSYIRQDPNFVEQAKSLKFWSVFAGVILVTVLIGVGLFCTGLFIHILTTTFANPKSALIAYQLVAPLSLVGSVAGIGCGVAIAAKLNNRVTGLNSLINQEEPDYVN